MASQSRNLGLIVPTTVDDFSTADIAQNWETIDESPGTYICTSTTRPTFTASQPGRFIYEKDTDLEWVWTGTEWRRSSPKGMLKKTDGTWAVGSRFTDFSSSSETSVLVVSVPNVVVPPGRRTLQITAAWTRAYSTSGYFYGRLYRSAVSNSGTMLSQFAIAGTIGQAIEDSGDSGFMSIYERDGLPPGVYDWSLQMAMNWSMSGTATFLANANGPVEISVVEL